MPLAERQRQPAGHGHVDPWRFPSRDPYLILHPKTFAAYPCLKESKIFPWCPQEKAWNVWAATPPLLTVTGFLQHISMSVPASPHGHGPGNLLATKLNAINARACTYENTGGEGSLIDATGNNGGEQASTGGDGERGPRLRVARRRRQLPPQPQPPRCDDT